MANIKKVIKFAGIFCLLVIAVLFYLNHPNLNIERKGRIYQEKLAKTISALQLELSKRDTNSKHRDSVPRENESEETKTTLNMLNESYKTHTFEQNTSDDNIKRPHTEFSKSDKCLTCSSYVDKGSAKNYNFFARKYSLDKEPFASWVKQGNTKTYCDNRIKVFNDMFAILHDVTMYPSRRLEKETQAKGGEEIRNVLNQGIAREDYYFDDNFFEIECTTNIGTRLSSNNLRLLSSVNLISVSREKAKNVSLKFNGKYAVAVRRQDYANLHNWVRNIYNIFVLLMHFRVQPKDVSVIFMDGHPRTELDNAWAIIYNKPIRVGRVEQTVTFQNLILGLEEHKGPITDFYLEQVPYLEEFRSFVLSQFNLNSSNSLNCASPRITVILRRNAVYHPRNVVGNVGRKIFNEAELMNDLMKAFPNACVKAALMEALPMASQLNLMKSTDIFIGMHGAGMSHVTFLPKHAGILELFAKDFKIGRPWFLCFEKIAKWRNMHYDSWENFDISLEMPADFTVLPTQVIVKKTQGLMNKICPR